MQLVDESQLEDEKTTNLNESKESDAGDGDEEKANSITD
jgi:hypothetical protein